MEPRLADVLPDGVVIADAHGKVALISAIAGRMLDVDRDTAVGRDLRDVVRLRDTDDHEWVSYNQPYHPFPTRSGIPEQSWLLPDGREVLVTARMERTRPGAPVSTVALSLRSGRGRARLDRDRSDLVATVAHELRSPLTGVKGFVQALLNRWEKLNDEQKRLMLTTVHADSDRLSRLIAELLDVARIDTGRLQLATRPVDARMLTARVVDSVGHTTSRELRFEAEAAEHRIHADPDKYTQVVSNLVENAVRHGDGAVTVRLGDRVEDDGTRGVRLVIDDEGDGIPAELRRRVFTKFWKGGTRGGSGLGLYIVGGLTRAHGGRVLLADAPGGGARITVDWPGERF